jgi:hypothetical protein
MRSWRLRFMGDSRRIGTAALAAGVMLASAASPGCRGSGTGRAPPKAISASYDGPPVQVESSGPQHVVILQAPSAGWAFTMDRSEPARGTTDVFLSATRPNPAFMHAQQVVPLRAGSGVAAGKPLDVYVRVLDFGNAGGSEPYRFATRARR